MKASELIVELQKLIEIEGDLPVNVIVEQEGDHGEEPCESIIRCCDKNEKVYAFLLGDREAGLAFTD